MGLGRGGLGGWGWLRALQFGGDGRVRQGGTACSPSTARALLPNVLNVASWGCLPATSRQLGKFCFFPSFPNWFDQTAGLVELWFGDGEKWEAESVAKHRGTPELLPEVRER